MLAGKWALGISTPRASRSPVDTDGHNAPLPGLVFWGIRSKVRSNPPAVAMSDVLKLWLN